MVLEYDSPKNYIDENGEFVISTTLLVSALVNALWNVMSYLVEAYMAGDEIEFKRIVQETVYGAICGAIGGVESKVIKVMVSMLVDVVNSIIKETI